MSMIDGKAIAAELETETRSALSKLAKPPVLAIVTVAPNFATRSYLTLKERKAKAVGVTVRLSVLSEMATTTECLAAVVQAAAQSDGVIVQLPLPPAIDTAAVIDSIPASHDVDNFSYRGEPTTILPPVVGAIDLIAARAGLSWPGKRVVVFGSGRLVGAPVAAYATAAGAHVTVVTESDSQAFRRQTARDADIIILGAGRPKLLTPAMVKPGVAVFDAGASEDGGLLVGDADPEVAKVASIFTPVPGGIGPITIALLFQNLLTLASRQ